MIYSLYFIAVVFCLNFIITNVFVSSVISGYNLQIQNIGKNALITDEQHKWIKAKRTFILAKPKILFRAPLNQVKFVFYKISISSIFQRILYVIILLNIVALALIYNSVSDKVNLIVKYANYSFSIIYGLEIVIKLYGQGMRYFKIKLNIFDTFLNALSIVASILELSLPEEDYFNGRN